MTLDVAFWVLAVICVGAALAVVFVRDVFRAALFLILCFFTVAGIYITLNADFLAAVQVLIYVGAVSVLLIFAIMLTRDAKQGSPSGRFGCMLCIRRRASAWAGTHPLRPLLRLTGRRESSAERAWEMGGCRNGC